MSSLSLLRRALARLAAGEGREAEQSTLRQALSQRLAGTADDMQPDAVQGIRAYHGSPHDFDQFSLDHIGSGEGAQAYGHGLYFAENEGVARDYRNALTRGSVSGYEYRGNLIPAGTPEHDIAYAAFQSSDGIGTPSGVGLDEALASTRKRYADAIATGAADRHGLRAQLEAAIRRIDAGGYRSEDFALRNPGRMYDVNLNAEPEQFLDWDAPLSGQSDHVRSVINRVGGDTSAIRARIAEIDAVRPFNDGPQHTLLARERMALLDELASADPKGSSIFRDHERGSTQYSELGPADAAAERLRDAGIPGIRYLDQGSRAAGEGSRNYVVFDPKIIEILRKYGLAGLGVTGAGAGSAMSLREALRARTEA